MIAIASMMPSAQAKLRYSQAVLTSSAPGATNYVNRIHVTFDGSSENHAQFQLRQKNGTYADVNIGDWTDTAGKIKGGDFYLDIGGGAGAPSGGEAGFPAQDIYENVTNDNSLVIAFRKDASTTSSFSSVILSFGSTTLKNGTDDKCGSSGALFIGRNSRSQYKDGAGAAELGTLTDYQCWCSGDNKYYDETAKDCVAGTAATDCKGRTSDGLEKHIVYPIQRNFDATCDYVVSSESPSSEFKDSVCTDTTAATAHPGKIGIDECQVEEDCKNQCWDHVNITAAAEDQTHYALQSARTCGAYRSDTDEENKPNPWAANKTVNTEFCKAVSPCKNGTETKNATQTAWSDVTCEPCPEGKRCIGNNAIDDCPANHYNDGSQGCKPVPNGFYGKAKNSFRNDTVTSGIGKSVQNAVAIEKCPDGYFNKNAGTCSESTAGREPTSDGTDEVDCPAGSKSVSGKDCELCPAGWKQAAAGQPICLECQKNKFEYSSKGATSCDLCSKGFGSDNENECVLCTEGTYSDGSTGACVNVTAGKSVRKEAGLRVDEQNCTAGFSSAGKKDDCTACDLREYQDEVGQASCKDVDVGNEPRDNSGYTTKGAVKQAICGDGYFSNSTSDECTSCPAGHYTSSNVTDGSCTRAVPPDYVDSNVKKTAVAADGWVPKPDGSGKVPCKSSEYVDKTYGQKNATVATVYCMKRNTPAGLNNAATTGGTPPATGGKIRLEFSYDGDHTVGDRQQCGTDLTLEGEKGATNSSKQGSLGLCKCVKAYGGGSDGYEHTTGCANGDAQCLHPLTCGGSCAVQKREDNKGGAGSCETTYIWKKEASGPQKQNCIAYHGEYAGKTMAHTWLVDSSYCEGVETISTF